MERRCVMTFEEAVEKLELRDFITEEPLSPEELIELFRFDLEEMIRRPGSWEADKMGSFVLDAPENENGDMEMLKNAVVDILERPGSAQSAKMSDLLQSHGLTDQGVSMEI